MRSNIILGAALLSSVMLMGVCTQEAAAFPRRGGGFSRPVYARPAAARIPYRSNGGFRAPAYGRGMPGAHLGSPYGFRGGFHSATPGFHPGSVLSHPHMPTASSRHPAQFLGALAHRDRAHDLHPGSRDHHT